MLKALIVLLAFIVFAEPGYARKKRRAAQKSGAAVSLAAAAISKYKIPDTPLVGPPLDQIRMELGRPMAELEEVDPKHLKVLAKPPALIPASSSGTNWFSGLLAGLWGMAFLGLGWTLRNHLPRIDTARYGQLARRMVPRTGVEIPRLIPAVAIRRRPRAETVASEVVARQPLRAPEAAVVVLPEELGKEEIVRLKALTGFETWLELLKAARCGSKSARAVVECGPGHPSVGFTLTSQQFKRHLPATRNIPFSEDWVRHIVGLLQDSETFDELLVVTSPLGQRHSIPMTAGVPTLNTVLGYETLAPEVRQQLEVRRWILTHTREDGAERTDVIAAFRARVAAAAVGGLMPPEVKAER